MNTSEIPSVTLYAYPKWTRHVPLRINTVAVNIWRKKLDRVVRARNRMHGRTKRGIILCHGAFQEQDGWIVWKTNARVRAIYRRLKRRNGKRRPK